MSNSAGFNFFGFIFAELIFFQAKMWLGCSELGLLGPSALIMNIWASYIVGPIEKWTWLQMEKQIFL